MSLSGRKKCRISLGWEYLFVNIPFTYKFVSINAYFVLDDKKVVLIEQKAFYLYSFPNDIYYEQDIETHSH